MILSKILLLVCAITTSNGVLCQVFSKAEAARAVTKIASLIKEKYVFETKGAFVSASLMAKLKKGEFVGVKDWNALADSLTSAMQSLSNDGHMYAKNDSKKVSDLIEAEKQRDTSLKDPSEDLFFYGDNAVAKNYGFDEVKILEGNIGYIKISEINLSHKSLPTLYASMQFVKHTKALIIDLRDNGGGGSNIGPVLHSYFLPAQKPLLEFVTRDGEKQKEETVNWLTEQKYENPLYIIVNAGTASAAEEFAFSMQWQKRAKIIGQPSAGAAHMNSWFVVNENLFVSISTAAPTIPGTEISWENVGVRLDNKVDAGKEIDFILKSIK